MHKQVVCFICGKNNLSRNEVALNKKIISRSVKKFHCFDCLSEHLEISLEELHEGIQEFKEAGCMLFK